jgi:hypothetical protein
MRPFNKIIVPMAALTLLCAQPRQAQSQALLGSDVSRPLSVTASTFAGYDTDITARGTRPPAGATGVDAGAANAGVSLNLSHGGGSSKINYYTTASSEYRYYRATETISSPLASGAAGFSAALGRRLRANASLASTYFPRFQFSVMPPTTDVPLDQPPPTLDYGISSYDVVSYQGTAALSYQLDSRSTATLSYGRNQFKYLGQDYELSTHSLSGGYSRNLTRYASLNLGYTELGGDYVTSAGRSPSGVRTRTIDAGIRYSRPLSLSRRTRFAFSTGSTALDNGTTTFYTVTGNANLNHQLSRTWSVGTAYSRRVGLVGGFTEPIFSDAITVNTGGMLGSRVSVHATTGYANGMVGLNSADRNYSSLQSSAGVSVPLTRRSSLFANYFYYKHMFEQSVTLPTGLAPRVARQGVRAGLSVKLY